MSQELQEYVNENQQYPETEYRERPVRRKFSKAYKRRIVKEAAKCGHGEVGSLLRREGLYSSQLTDWRRQEAKGELAERATPKRGRNGNAQTKAMAALQEENVRISRKLEQAELIIDAQKKLALALEQTLSEPKDKN